MCLTWRATLVTTFYSDICTALVVIIIHYSLRVFPMRSINKSWYNNNNCKCKVSCNLCNVWPQKMWTLIVRIRSRQSLTHFFFTNSASVEVTFQQDGKRRTLSPFTRKNSHSDPQNYRSISLLSDISKVMEHVVNRDLRKHPFSHGLHDQQQPICIPPTPFYRRRAHISQQRMARLTKKSSSQG